MARLVLILVLLSGLFAAPQIVLAADTDDVTANRTLQRGTIIREGDVSGPYATEDFVGLEVVRTLRAGAIMTPRHVRTPLMVKRNETVTLIFRQGSLKMETLGRALDEGSEGDRVSVMNASSRKRITGRIIGEGLVEVSS